MAHSTCNYRSYSYTTRSELAGRWEGRKALQRSRRQWPMWERWRRSPPWSVFILRSWQGNISAPSCSSAPHQPQARRRRRRRRRRSCSCCLSGGQLIMTDREAGLNILPHLHQLPSQCNQIPSSHQIYSPPTQSVW